MSYQNQPENSDLNEFLGIPIINEISLVQCTSVYVYIMYATISTYKM